jgi:single-stranded-DNA-specific exonuclease
MTAFGGHAMAAGLTLDANQYPQFMKSVDEAVTFILDGAELSAELLTDGELSAAEISLGFASSLEQLGPWGQRFPEPVFDGLFEVIENRVVGGSHLKMICLHPAPCVYCIAWGSIAGAETRVVS